ncbi:MAG TPA: reverse transcriptase domain-containing protein, partial [Oculatellaceae cyanobacterium]
QVPGIDYTEKFSPLATDTTTRLLIALTLWNQDKQWVCESIDIEAAFLEGSIEEPTFMEFPPGAVKLGYITEQDKKSKCIQLKKSIYGNVNASLCFYRTYSEHLIKELLMKRSQTDACVFYKHNDQGDLLLATFCHVDDTQIVGSREEIDKFKEGVKKQFGIKEMGCMIKHLGIKYNWTQENGEPIVEATMSDLIQEIIKITEDHVGKTVKKKNLPAPQGLVLEKGTGGVMKDESMYKTVVGKIMYLVNKIMIEGINAARELTKFFGCPEESHWRAVIHFVGYLKNEGSNVKLTYRKPKELRYIAMVDASFGTCPESRKSITGAIHTIGGCIINWSSKSQRRSALSLTESEYYAISSAAQELLFVNHLLGEFGCKVKQGFIFNDNTGAIQLVKNRQVSPRTKHIDICHHFVRDLWEEKDMEIKYVNTEMNEADLCTKNVAKPIHTTHRENIRAGSLNVWKQYEIAVQVAQREDVETDTRVQSVQATEPADEEGFILVTYAKNKVMKSKDKVSTFDKKHKVNL